MKSISLVGNQSLVLASNITGEQKEGDGAPQNTAGTAAENKQGLVNRLWESSILCGFNEWFNLSLDAPPLDTSRHARASVETKEHHDASDEASAMRSSVAAIRASSSVETYSIKSIEPAVRLAVAPPLVLGDEASRKHADKSLADEEYPRHNKRRQIIIILVLFLLLGTVAGVVVILTSSKSTSQFATAPALAECETACTSDKNCVGNLICESWDELNTVSQCGDRKDAVTVCVSAETTTLPSAMPSDAPSDRPSDVPSDAPSLKPSNSPSRRPSAFPSASPTGLPSASPTRIPTQSPSTSPTIAPTTSASPTETIPITYTPGEATVRKNGLMLSTGLDYRVIAVSGTRVRLANDTQSARSFHSLPDGAAVFADPETGGWVYVSNSESSDEGGVGALYFDRDGNVEDYRILLSGTRRNCGGGKTFWNTWLTCEELTGGQVFEVDPWGRQAARRTVLGGNRGAWYESAAYDNRDPSNPTFYVTIDEQSGPLLRFTPSRAAIDTARFTGDYSELLHTPGTREFMVLNWNARTFYWTTDESVARQSAFDYYQHAEGIDIRNGRLYMTTKMEKLLFILDLDTRQFTVSSTRSGAFSDQPDQVAHIVRGDDILYFCEDGGSRAGIHGRDASGRFFTILEAGSEQWFGETTGLAFSPDNMRMYVSYQWFGRILEVWRTDGRPFGGQRLDIKYHAEDGTF